MEEKLIELVQTFPLLYDSTLKEYRNQTLKESAWLKIAQSMGGDQGWY
jgi:hypothetical protein